MSHTAILLIFLSAAIHAVWNLLGKRGEHLLVFFWWALVFELLIFSPLGIYVFLTQVVDPRGWYAVLSSGGCTALFVIFLASSYKCGDLSLAYPITRSSPVFVSILAVFLFGERLSAPGGVGILLAIFGVYMIPMQSLAPGNLDRPFSHLKSHAVLFAGLTALANSFHHLIDKVGTQFFTPIVYVWAVDFVGFCFLTIWIVFSEKRRSIRREWNVNKWYAAATGALMLLSYSLIVFVMRFENVSYIITMRQVSIVFGVILGNILLKERYGLVRFVASCIILCGVACIGVGG